MIFLLTFCMLKALYKFIMPLYIFIIKRNNNFFEFIYNTKKPVAILCRFSNNISIFCQLMKLVINIQ